MLKGPEMNLTTSTPLCHQLYLVTEPYIGNSVSPEMTIFAIITKFAYYKISHHLSTVALFADFSRITFHALIALHSSGGMLLQATTPKPHAHIPTSRCARSIHHEPCLRKNPKRGDSGLTKRRLYERLF